jgi:hypothetical protein
MRIYVGSVIWGRGTCNSSAFPRAGRGYVPIQFSVRYARSIGCTILATAASFRMNAGSLEQCDNPRIGTG